MRNDDGSVLVEAAIVLPVMLTVIIGGLDLGLGMVAATRLNFATESAAKCGALAVPRICPDAAHTAAFAATQSSAPASALGVSECGGFEQVTRSVRLQLCVSAVDYNPASVGRLPNRSTAVIIFERPDGQLLTLLFGS